MRAKLILEFLEENSKFEAEVMVSKITTERNLSEPFPSFSPVPETIETTFSGPKFSLKVLDGKWSNLNG